MYKADAGRQGTICYLCFAGHLAIFDLAIVNCVRHTQFDTGPPRKQRRMEWAVPGAVGLSRGKVLEAPQGRGQRVCNPSTASNNSPTSVPQAARLPNYVVLLIYTARETSTRDRPATRPDGWLMSASMAGGSAGSRPI